MPAAAGAQGIACQRATTPIDKAVCASPQLLALDKALNEAFEAASSRNPDGKPALMQAQRAWLTSRRQECGTLTGAALNACLDRSFTRRIAELRATGAPAAQAQVPAAAPQPPAPLALALPDRLAVATGAPTQQGPAVDTPAARLERDTWPSAGQTDTLLTVTTPGRFSITAQSATGTALQLVDMLAGPGDWAGEAGATDGRLDLLLDVGTYKLRSQGAEGATGETKVTVTPFRDAAPPAVLRAGDSISATLADHEQRGYWITLDQTGPLRVEGAGRALAEMAIWREGRDRVPTSWRRRTIEPTRGHPLGSASARLVLEAGTYLVTAYGGPDRPWADGDTARPFHLRLGESDAFASGYLAGRIGPFGSEVVAVPSQADQFRLDLPQPADARLVMETDGGRPLSAEIAANSRQPTAWIRAEPRDKARRSIIVTGAEGQSFALRSFGDGAGQPGKGRQLMLAEMPGSGGDEVPPSGLLLRRDEGKAPVFVSGFGPEIGPGKAWRSRFNLRRPVTIFFHVAAPGTFALRADGVALRLGVRPAQGQLPPAPVDGLSPMRWDLTEGWYALRLEPQVEAGGVLDIVLGPPGVVPASPETPLPADPVLLLGEQAVGENQRLPAGQRHRPPHLPPPAARPRHAAAGSDAAPG